MSSVHLLDNPIWHALSSAHSGFSIGRALARSYPLEVAPFAACADTSSAAFAELGALLEQQRMAAMLTAQPLELPEGWQVLRRAVISQMVCEAFLPIAAPFEFEPLHEADVSEMAALVELTKPGPFQQQTIRMGAYFGLRLEGKLVAMAGERLQMSGYTEVSAVCTHPDFEGRGYGKALVQRVCEGILARGETPFLHVKTNNLRAVKAYERLGFRARANIHLTILRLPES